MIGFILEDLSKTRAICSAINVITSLESLMQLKTIDQHLTTNPRVLFFKQELYAKVTAQSYLPTSTKLTSFPTYEKLGTAYKIVSVDKQQHIYRQDRLRHLWLILTCSLSFCAQVSHFTNLLWGDLYA